jgi:hypothetical protein
MAENDLEGISLADLEGLDTSGLDAKHFGEAFPRCVADFECVEAEMKELKENTFAVNSVWECKGVHTIIDKDVKEEDLIGRKHTQFATIKDKDGVQFFLGFLEDIGIKERGKLGAIVGKMKGIKIKTLIAHRKDKNDPDRVYAGFTKIKPIA